VGYFCTLIDEPRLDIQLSISELEQMVSMPERGKLKHTCAAVLLLQDVGTQSSVTISNREGPSSRCARKVMSKVKVGLD
jgi:hypothetical protein